MRIWLGLVFLLAGFAGHFFAARAIGGTYLAYRDHMAGFFGLTLISGAILWALGSRFWRGRPDITILTLGILQALIGFVIYLERFKVHG
jgi:hypothetical protein